VNIVYITGNKMPKK